MQTLLLIRVFFRLLVGDVVLLPLFVRLFRAVLLLGRAAAAASDLVHNFNTVLLVLKQLLHDTRLEGHICEHLVLNLQCHESSVNIHED